MAGIGMGWPADEYRNANTTLMWTLREIREIAAEDQTDERLRRIAAKADEVLGNTQR